MVICQLYAKDSFTLSCGVTVANCSLGYEAAIKSGVECELGAAGLWFDMKLRCELMKKLEELAGAEGTYISKRLSGWSDEEGVGLNSRHYELEFACRS